MPGMAGRMHAPVASTTARAYDVVVRPVLEALRHGAHGVHRRGGGTGALMRRA